MNAKLNPIPLPASPLKGEVSTLQRPRFSPSPSRGGPGWGWGQAPLPTHSHPPPNRPLEGGWAFITASRHRGFTLIELTVTLAILAVLATLAVPVAQVTVQRHKEKELRLALQEIRSALDAYRNAVEQGHIQKRADASQYPKSLDLLVEGVPDALDPTGARMYFLRRVPRDPMTVGDGAQAADTWGKRAYASPPDAPQEGDDVYDVFSRSDKLGLNGVPYRKW